MSPEKEIFTFKQGSEESFKDAWSRISESYAKTEPKMTLSLLLSSFYFGLVLCYRYAVDAVLGGDFLRYDGDQAFNAIKMITISSPPISKIDSALTSISDRLNTLETNISGLKEGYNQIREHYDNVPVNFEPSGWVPSVKLVINGETFHARCDIMSEFCLMPKDIFDSLNLWELSKCEDCIILGDNTIKLPREVAEGVFTKLLGITISIDYLVIECAGVGQITLGRSLLKRFGAIIDVGQGTMNFASSPMCNQVFPKDKGKGKRAKRKNVDASSLGNT
jgi:hypothetical protein